MVLQKTTSIVAGLFRASKWLPKRPPLLLLVFFKPVNGHLKDHRSRVGEHPAAASGGTPESAPAAEKPIPPPSAGSLGRPPGRPNRGHAARTGDSCAGVGLARGCRERARTTWSDAGEDIVRIVPPYRTRNAPVRAAAIIFPCE